MKQTENSGFSIHCHHDILVEWCYDYEERVEVIKKDKPKNEQEIRLRLFKILPEEAVKEIPKARQEADKAWQEADKARPQNSKDAFHKRWCGCSEWKNGEINFIKK